MSFLKSLPEDAPLLEVFRRHYDLWRPILDYHERLMRAGSPLAPADCELIAAFVSALNGCDYCHGVHSATAARFGVDPALLGRLLTDIDRADVREALRPVFRYVRKLTLGPAKMAAADADAVFAAGWGEDALHQAASVCALYNFMNRVVNGLGVRAGEGYFAESSARLAGGGYRALLDMLDAE